MWFLPKNACGFCPCIAFFAFFASACIHLHYNCITILRVFAFGCICIFCILRVFAFRCICIFCILRVFAFGCICIFCILRLFAFRCIMQYLHSLHLRVIAFRCIICCIVYSGHDFISFAIYEGKNLRQVHPDSSPSPPLPPPLKYPPDSSPHPFPLPSLLLLHLLLHSSCLGE